MLDRIKIEDVAVIAKAEVEFNPSLNVLTGETGAGKSLIIDSINMVLGQRTSKELVRSGAKKAVATALFHFDYKMDFLDEDNCLVLSREIYKDGRNVCKINGELATVSMLKELAKSIVNIHGQQDNQALLRSDIHIDFLDKFALTKVDEYKKLYYQLKDIDKEIARLESNEAQKASKIDLLSYQINEIEVAALKPNEDQELLVEQSRLSNVERLRELTGQAHEAIYGDEISANSLLDMAVKLISDAAVLDESLEELSSAMTDAKYAFLDAASEISNYVDHLYGDPDRLEEVESRLDTLYKLKKKYGGTIESVLEFYDKAALELDGITGAQDRIEQLIREKEQIFTIMKAKAKELTEVRGQAAKALKEKIMHELFELDMTKVKFEVNIEPCEFNSKGADAVEFMISTNPIEPLKSLDRIASGGEMSRIMLALKTVLAEGDIVPTLIFDEIDQGVSGRAAQKIAEKLHRLGEKYQVLCITHLPQIAAMADFHYQIEKDTEDEGYSTKVVLLDEDKRVEEISRIIGGAQVTNKTRESAAEMIKLGKK